MVRFHDATLCCTRIFLLPSDAQETRQWQTRSSETRLWLPQANESDIRSPRTICLYFLLARGKKSSAAILCNSNHTRAAPSSLPRRTNTATLCSSSLCVCSRSKLVQFGPRGTRTSEILWAGGGRAPKPDTRFVFCPQLPPVTAAASAQPHRPPGLYALQVLSVDEGGSLTMKPARAGVETTAGIILRKFVRFSKLACNVFMGDSQPFTASFLAPLFFSQLP